MMEAAARTLAEHSPALRDPTASLLPPLRNIRAVAVAVAIAVGLEAQRVGVAPKTSQEELIRRVTQTQWTPQYSTDAPLS
jgi:malate dehydrogenase (oxaloacetate-decarboxylating)